MRLRHAFKAEFLANAAAAGFAEPRCLRRIVQYLNDTPRQRVGVAAGDEKS